MNSEMKRRLAMTVAGVLIAGFSVGMFQYSAMGLDPFQVFAHGVWKRINGPSFGFVYMVLNMLLLAVDFFFLDRKKIGIATFINLFLLGYITQFTLEALQGWFPAPGIALRILFLLIGIVVICIGSALYMTADLGVSTYDSVAITMADKWKWGKFQYIRIATDIVCVVLGTAVFLIGGGSWSRVPEFVGVGTIITAFFMGPLIEFFNVRIARPLLKDRQGEA